ncbi:MAG: hypothetical protein AAFR50_03390 [Pseudomonadota bacterium]
MVNTRSVFDLPERLLVGAALLAAVVFAGFHAGTIGAKLAFPVAGAADAAETGPRGFDEAAVTTTAREVAAIAPIFGAPEVGETAPAPAPVAQNTTYELEGITITEFGRWAMLNADGASRLLREGDALSETETVVSISPDTVIIQQGEVLSVVRFVRADEELSEEELARQASLEADLNPPEENFIQTVAAPPTPAPEVEIEEVSTTRPPVELQVLRQALYAPNALSDVQFVRARLWNGSVGLQLKWFKDNPIITAMGLQRGDVLAAINGVPITDPQALQALALQVGQLDEIVLFYERKSTVFDVTVPLIK